MVMPAPGRTDAPYPAPNLTHRRGNGCLWGCLGLVLLLALPALLAGGYGAWFLHTGYRRDPVLRLVGELARRDGTVQNVLGADVRITGVEGNSFAWVMGMGGRSAYAVTLEGYKGEGRLDVTAQREKGRTRLDRAILTGPDGRRYDLLGRPRPLPDNTI